MDLQVHLESYTLRLWHDYARVSKIAAEAFLQSQALCTLRLLDPHYGILNPSPKSPNLPPEGPK